LTAGGGADAALAVEALGDDPRQGGLAHAPGAGEEIGVVQAPVVEAVDQGLQHMLLPIHLVEGAGAPFAGEDLIAHGQPAWETSGALYGHGPGVSRHGARPRRRELPGKGISANPSPDAVVATGSRPATMARLIQRGGPLWARKETRETHWSESSRPPRGNSPPGALKRPISRTSPGRPGSPSSWCTTTSAPRTSSTGRPSKRCPRAWAFSTMRSPTPPWHPAPPS